MLKREYCFYLFLLGGLIGEVIGLYYSERLYRPPPIIRTIIVDMARGVR